MRKIIIFVLVMVTLFGATVKACDYESHYKRLAIITKIENEIVTVEDLDTGNIWEFNGTGFDEGDEVRLVFFDNHTEEIEDDEIVDVERVD